MHFYSLFLRFQILEICIAVRLSSSVIIFDRWLALVFDLNWGIFWFYVGSKCVTFYV